MRAVKIISKSRDRMEIIGRDEDGLRTLHIKKRRGEWRYCVGHDKGDKQVFLPIRFLNE